MSGVPNERLGLHKRLEGLVAALRAIPASVLILYFTVEQTNDINEFLAEAELARTAPPQVEMQVEASDNYVAWCRYTPKSIVTCDSDAPGAFRVYRQPQAPSVELLQLLKDSCDRDWKDETPEQIIRIACNALYWRDYEIAKLKKVVMPLQSEPPATECRCPLNGFSLEGAIELMPHCPMHGALVRTAPPPKITISTGALPGCTAQAIEESGRTVALAGQASTMDGGAGNANEK